MIDAIYTAFYKRKAGEKFSIQRCAVAQELRRALSITTSNEDCPMTDAIVSEKVTYAFKAVLFLLVGAGLMIAAIATTFNTLDFLQTSLVAPGHVTELNHGGSHPEVAITTRSGERVSYPQNGLIFGLKPGDEVQVRYLPDSPRTSARADLVGSIWGWSIVTGLIGFIALVVGLDCLEKSGLIQRKNDTKK